MQLPICKWTAMHWIVRSATHSEVRILSHTSDSTDNVCTCATSIAHNRRYTPWRRRHHPQSTKPSASSQKSMANAVGCDRYATFRLNQSHSSMHERDRLCPVSARSPSSATAGSTQPPLCESVDSVSLCVATVPELIATAANCVATCASK